MNNTNDQPAILAREQVAKYRAKGNSERLAEALEDLASALLKEVDLGGAATALEEAAEIWSGLGAAFRQGSCLLLAASSCRLAGDLNRAKRNLELGLAAELPQKLKNGFQAEWCEQELANGRYDSAHEGFTRLLSHLSNELEPLQQAQLYQRRAAAATAGQRWFEAADDFLKSSTIFKGQGLHADAEASALAAAAILADVAPEAAERIISEISETVPGDGAAAARRGLVGGKVALQAGVPALALKRFDQARQGALDVNDPVTYWSAAVQASQVAESLADFETAYARLATAWATLADLLGTEQSAQMIRPVLEEFRNRLGKERFTKVKQQYEKKDNRRDPDDAIKSPAK